MSIKNHQRQLNGCFISSRLAVALAGLSSNSSLSFDKFMGIDNATLYLTRVTRVQICVEVELL